MEKSSERLVTAYQEGLLTLAQLRQRMPPLQKQTQAVESELQSLKMAAVDEAKYLQLAESLAGFRSKLRVRAEALDIAVRQQILRLLVKEVLVGGNTITLRHSIPIPQSGPGSNGSPGPASAVTGSRPTPGYLLHPKISLAGALGFDSINGGTLVNGKAFQAVGTGSLRWRLFDFGRVKAEIAQSRGAYAEAPAAYRQAALKATEDIENAMELAQAQGSLEQLRDEVASLTRARDLSERAYKAGAITLTDVLDADRQLLVARDEVESTRADAARAAVRAFRALGGGWDVSSHPSLSKMK